mgnify:CR=1 FL=1
MKLVWYLLYCMEQKHGHWQADWWMFFAEVIAGCWDTWPELGGKTGGLAVMWQRCVVLKTFLLRHRRLRWIENVKRAEGFVLSEVDKVRVGGRQTAGRPRKIGACSVLWVIWTSLLGVEEHVVQEWHMWKAVIAR